MNRCAGIERVLLIIIPGGGGGHAQGAAAEKFHRQGLASGQVRTDGELFWILKNGSKGTAMAAFIPLILTEEEAWQILRYVRSFATLEAR